MKKTENQSSSGKYRQWTTTSTSVYQGIHTSL